MRVGMTLLAEQRRDREIRIQQLTFHVWRLMAANTFDGAMRTCKGKLCRSVVETSEVVPLFRGVASFATNCFAIGTYSLHARTELTAMRVGMTRGAREIGKVIRDRFVRLRRLVAVHARNRRMAAGQLERRFLVTGDGKCRRMEVLLVVALLAAV